MMQAEPRNNIHILVLIKTGLVELSNPALTRGDSSFDAAGGGKSGLGSPVLRAAASSPEPRS